MKNISLQVDDRLEESDSGDDIREGEEKNKPYADESCSGFLNELRRRKN